MQFGIEREKSGLGVQTRFSEKSVKKEEVIQNKSNEETVPFKGECA